MERPTDWKRWPVRWWREEKERIREIIEDAKARVGMEHVSISAEWNTRFTRRMGDASPMLRRTRYSKPLWPLASPEEREETVRHEVAHVLANIKYGANCAHDRRWQAMHRACGGKKGRTHNVDRGSLGRKQARFAVPCPGCSRVHSVSKSMRTKWIRRLQIRVCACRTRLPYTLVLNARLAS